MRNLSDAELAQLLDKEIFHTIGDVADRIGVDCYVVGGYVRDLFLERPSSDIDVVVIGSGIKVAEALKEILDTLTQREADVLKMRFGMYDGRTHTLEEVGQIFGVTRERIRQIENKAIRKLRHPSRAKKIRDFYC